MSLPVTLARRVIACLDVHAGCTVKGVQFVNLREAGDPAELAWRHAASGADEIVLLDISATHEERSTLLTTVRRTAERLFVPFCVGGGIRTLDDAARVLECGADKVSLNSAAVQRPALITEIANRFGSQAVVLAIDAQRADIQQPITQQAGDLLNKKNNIVLANVTVRGGRKATNWDATDWAREAECCGAGEILLTCMQRDGTKQGFDCELTAQIADAVRVPVIASGGAGSPAHFVEVFREGRADAALAASIFHFGEHAIASVKQAMANAGIPVRYPC